MNNPFSLAGWRAKFAGSAKPASVAKAGPPKFKVSVIIQATPVPEAGGVWAFYPMARSMFVTQHPELYTDQSGTVIPTFEEEVYGRFTLADGTDNLVKQGKPAPSKYLADILRIHQAGFLREYVWSYFCQPAWRDDQLPGKLLAFIAWARVHLNEHVLETYGGICITREDGPGEKPALREVNAQNGGGAELNVLVAAIFAKIQQANFPEAAQLLVEFSAAASRLQPAEATCVCIQSQRQLNYFVLSRPEIKQLRVLDWCVAMGIYFRALLASKLRRFDEALAGLETTLKLAPCFAQGYAEQGFVLMRLQRAPAALAAYEKAWSLVTRHPENFHVAGPAMRGRAAVLVELGDLDRAEQWLRDSLALEPQHPVALQELAYIAQRRAGMARH